MDFQLIQAIKTPIYGIKLIAPGNTPGSKRIIKTPCNGIKLIALGNTPVSKRRIKTPCNGKSMNG